MPVSPPRPSTSLSNLAQLNNRVKRRLPRPKPPTRLGSTSKTDASSKKRAGSRDGALGASTGTGKAPLRIVRSATSGPLQPRAALQSPWEKYEKIYNVEIGSPVEVAVRKSPPVELVHVRTFTTQAAAETLHKYRQLQHRNIVTAVEAFTTDTGLYIILEYMPLSLEQIVRSPAYPDERQLVAILGQPLLRGYQVQHCRSSRTSPTGIATLLRVEGGHSSRI